MNKIRKSLPSKSHGIGKNDESNKLGKIGCFHQLSYYAYKRSLLINKLHITQIKSYCTIFDSPNKNRLKLKVNGSNLNRWLRFETIYRFATAQVEGGFRSAKGGRNEKCRINERRSETEEMKTTAEKGMKFTQTDQTAEWGN